MRVGQEEAGGGEGTASDDRRGERHEDIGIPMNYGKQNRLSDFFVEEKDVERIRGIQNTS